MALNPAYLGGVYAFATADPRRAIEQLKEWSAKFGAERVQCNEGFEALARPLMGPQKTH